MPNSMICLLRFSTAVSRIAPTSVAPGDLTALSVMQMSTRVDALEAAIQDIINGDAAPPGPPSMPQSPAVAQRRSGGV